MSSDEEQALNFKVFLKGPMVVSALLQAVEVSAPADRLKGKGQPKAPDIADPLGSSLDFRSTIGVKCFGEPTGALDEYIAYITSAFATLVENYNEMQKDNRALRERLDKLERTAAGYDDYEEEEDDDDY